MTKRYDMCIPRPGKGGKTFWHKIGVAFPSRSKDDFDLIFDSLPVPEFNEQYGLRVRAKLFPVRDEGRSNIDPGGAPRPKLLPSDEVDDPIDIPF